MKITVPLERGDGSIVYDFGRWFDGTHRIFNTRLQDLQEEIKKASDKIKYNK